MVAEANGCEQTMEGYLNYIREHFQKGIQEMEEYFPVISENGACSILWLVDGIPKEDSPY